MTRETDLTRVVCALEEIPDGGARGFTLGAGDWPLRGLLVRQRERVEGFVNRCPHAGHPLNLRPHGFLSPGETLIVCASHGALFEKMTGLCILGPCAGQSLERVPLRVEAGYVMLAEGYEPARGAEN
jgi:nitrite reductase/ring-hydroxylating ferredoxin subunit